MGEQQYESVWDNLRILQEWGPLVSYIRDFLQTDDIHKKLETVANACEWLAAKSKTKVDDQLVRLLAAALRSPDGEALLRWLLAKINGEPKA